MEAVPRLHMLWFALKSSPEGTSFAALKKVSATSTAAAWQRQSDGRRTKQIANAEKGAEEGRGQTKALAHINIEQQSSGTVFVMRALAGGAGGTKVAAESSQLPSQLMSD